MPAETIRVQSPGQDGMRVLIVALRESHYLPWTILRARFSLSAHPLCAGLGA
jgi:hypothetical protein